MAFPTTRWSLLAQATINGGPSESAALGEFYRRYREPVVGFIRQHPAAGTPAEDLAQEFFLQLIKDSTLQRADPARGRFRSFLLGALARFLARSRVRHEAVKRGGGEVSLSLDELGAGSGEPVVPPAVAQAFDREWATDLLARVRGELEAEWRARGETAELNMLLRYLPGGLDTPSYETAAAGLGWPPARLKTEVFRLRQEFRERVRAEVALTVEAPHEIESEMAHLHSVLADPAV